MQVYVNVNGKVRQIVAQDINELLHQLDIRSGRICNSKGHLISELSQNSLDEPYIVTDNASLATKTKADFINQLKPSSSQTLVDIEIPKEKLADFDFDMFDYTESELAGMLICMCSDLSLDTAFNINKESLLHFVKLVVAHYSPAPFHNFHHCFSVTQMAYAFLRKSNLYENLPPLEKLILFISCIGHDLDHPGTTNAFQKTTQSPLSFLYNGISPLENHHCSMTFRLLKESKLLNLMNVAQWNRFRSGVIKCILATDMKNHSTILNDIDAVADKFDLQNESHRLLIVLLLLKCSDLSNECRSPSVARKWVDALYKEFDQQRLLKKESSRVFNEAFQKEIEGRDGQQAEFLDHSVLPLYERLAKLTESPAIEGCVNYLKETRDAYLK